MGVRVFHVDAAKLGMCNKGQRLFARLHGLDFHDFLHNGIDADLLPRDDAQVAAVVRMAQHRIAEEADSGQKQ